MIEEDDTASAARFGGSAYKKSSSNFQKKPAERKKRVPFTPKSDPPSWEKRNLRASENPISANVIITPTKAEISRVVNERSCEPRSDPNKRCSTDLLDILNLDDSNRDVSVYLGDSTTGSNNSSFLSHDTPLRKRLSTSYPTSSLVDSSVSLARSTIGKRLNFDLVDDKEQEAGDVTTSARILINRGPAGKPETWDAALPAGRGPSNPQPKRATTLPTLADAAVPESNTQKSEVTSADVIHVTPAARRTPERDKNRIDAILVASPPYVKTYTSPESLSLVQLRDWMNPAPSDDAVWKKKWADNKNSSVAVLPPSETLHSFATNEPNSIGEKEANSYGKMIFSVVKNVVTPETVASTPSLSGMNTSDNVESPPPLDDESTVRTSNLLNKLDKQAKSTSDVAPLLDETSVSSNHSENYLHVADRNLRPRNADFSFCHAEPSTAGPQPKMISDTCSTSFIPAKTFLGVMYPGKSDMASVLFVVESKRQCWFQNEMEASRREWNYYKKWLHQGVHEIARVEDLIRCSYAAFTGYSNSVDDIRSDAFMNDDGEILTKRQKTRQQKKRVEKLVESETGANFLLDPMMEAFAILMQELDTQVPSLEENAQEAAALKKEIAAKAKDLEDTGNAIGVHAVELAEANIQATFESLMKVADWYDSPRTKGHVKNADEADDGMRDRWLFETRYRNAAKLGLLTWKENRRDCQKLYAEIIRFDDDRKSRLKEIMLSFLPRRKRLMDSAHGALMLGSDALDTGKPSKSKGFKEIERALAKIMITIPSNTKLVRTKYLGEMNQNDAKDKDYSAGLCKDLWESSYVKERQLVRLKSGKVWKTAVCVTTHDNYMHIFVASVADSDKTLQAVTQSLLTPVTEHSVKLAEFDVAILPDLTEIELLRRGRSVIFRKRDDHIVLKMDAADVAKGWVESVLNPVSSRAEL